MIPLTIDGKPARVLGVHEPRLPGDYVLFAAGWLRQLEPAEWHPIQDYDLLPIENAGPEQLVARLLP